MDKTYKYSIFFSLCILVASSLAVLLYAFNNQWIIIACPSHIQHERAGVEGALTKKCTVWYWHGGHWHHEEVELLWQEDLPARLHTLVSRWLTVLQEEQVWPEYTVLQTVITSPASDHFYCSFERSPFTLQMSMYEKLVWIEGLLKTIRSNEPKARAIHLLVQHQPLLDSHLALNSWWPIEGFLGESN
jgi:hypothetical protein